GELSTGNRQRLALSRAMLHNPRVLLLDEPTSALDPIAAKRVRELIMSLAKKYKQTFFINSHNLGEVQRMCDRIAIIDDGKILLAGETRELRSRLQAKQEFVIRVAGDPKEAAAIAEASDFVEGVAVSADSVSVTIANPVENNWRLMQTLLARGVRIVEFAEDEATLEDLYLEVVKGGRN
ncbi:ABC transporter ATP-binding protein, partial [Candidatus Thorarchaeota archaeon]